MHLVEKVINIPDIHQLIQNLIMMVEIMEKNLFIALGIIYNVFIEL